MTDLPNPLVETRHHARLAQIRKWADNVASRRSRWRTRSQYFHDTDEEYLRFLIPENLRVLELGCGTGDVLAALRPQVGVGIDISSEMIRVASKTHPGIDFQVLDIEDVGALEHIGRSGPFDVVLLDSTLGFLSDIQCFLERLLGLCGPETRLVVTSHSYMWEPLFTVAALFGRRMATPEVTWLRLSDATNLLELSSFDIVKKESRLLSPYRLFGVGSFINRFIATLPLIQNLCLRQYLVARPIPRSEDIRPLSASVVIPCRNERGNIEAAVQRLPQFCDSLEIIFVEGHSEDGTWEEILRVQAAYPTRNIRSLQQSGKGKGDAVRTAFSQATGDVLIILDADLTVPPEDLPKFYSAIRRGVGEYIQGSRMVYDMDSGAMRFLNRLANHCFAKIFSYLLNQTYTDTLCGTKVLRRSHYQAIARNRTYFGDFDPFGDFDLIFGAAKLNLKVVEIPIRYASREYGSTQISRFRHGILLLRMVIFAWRKLKAL